MACSLVAFYSGTLITVPVLIYTYMHICTNVQQIVNFPLKTIQCDISFFCKKNEPFSIYLPFLRREGLRWSWSLGGFTKICVLNKKKQHTLTLLCPEIRFENFVCLFVWDFCLNVLYKIFIWDFLDIFDVLLSLIFWYIVLYVFDIFVWYFCFIFCLRFLFQILIFPGWHKLIKYLKNHLGLTL